MVGRVGSGWMGNGMFLTICHDLHLHEKLGIVFTVNMKQFG